MTNETDQALQLYSKGLFNTLDELMQHPYFKSKVRSLLAARSLRPSPKAGYRYKRDWYDQLESKRQDNVPFFTSNWRAVIEKTSTQPAYMRAAVSYVCEQAMRHTVLELLTKAVEEAKRKDQTAQGHIVIEEKEN